MEVFGIGLPELLVIVVAILVFVGPERLPEAARTIGKGIGDFRRAIEPARGAWRDLTSEITNVSNEVSNTVKTVGTSATSLTRPTIKPARKGEVTTAIPNESPWAVHPIMENMTPEERTQFMAGGQIPPHIMEEIAAKQAQPGIMVPYTPPVVDLDYPMPHSELTYQPAPAFTQQIEELSYPEPGEPVLSAQESTAVTTPDA